ncbi:Hypothetical protein HDN1F_23100 [gamma proteobacterium HdN1]|nr:Hypothetical protein HDN1F_23100 [gamma proteobacterium HdN1]
MTTSTITNTGSNGLNAYCGSTQNHTQYFVRRGDTLESIAANAGISPQQLRDANPDLNDPDWLLQGQAITVPSLQKPSPAPVEDNPENSAPWNGSLWQETPPAEKAFVSVGYGFHQLNQGLDAISAWHDDTVKQFDTIADDPNTSDSLRMTVATLKLPGRIGTSLAGGVADTASLITNPESRAQMANGVRTLYENPQFLVEAAKDFARKPLHEQASDVIVMVSDLPTGGKGALKLGAKANKLENGPAQKPIETKSPLESISRKQVLPESLDDARNLLIQRRADIIANGYQPKYSDAELAYLAHHGNVGEERFQVRFMEEGYLNARDTPNVELSGRMGNLLETETGRGAKYWSTSFDQLEDADSDPKLIAEKLGLDYNPSKKYVLIVVDMEKSTPLTGIKSISATFEKLSQFSNEELPKSLPKSLTDKIMTAEFQAVYNNHYNAAIISGDLPQWSKDVNKFADYLEKTSLSPDKIDLLKYRMIMHDKIGNNHDYLGNGLTKDNNPKSTNQFGAVETFNFERNDVDLKTLHAAGAIQIIKGLTTI